MKDPTYFAHFLDKTVNLNQARLDDLDDSVEAIFRALKSDDELGPFVRAKIRQGSWAHRTIIKPVGDHEFDADFLLVLDENPDWGPSDYIDKVWAALHRHSVYKEMPHNRHCRCVRIQYAESTNYHVDIVPQVTLNDGRTVIVNGDENVWENSDPAGFTTWIKEKDDITGGNLRKVIRILKYLRDHKGTFERTRSVILTTLVGERVNDAAKVSNPGYYADVPTTLVNVIEDLDAYLKANETVPHVPDPSGSGEDFDHRWDQDIYDNFKRRIDQYARAIRAAYDESDFDESVAQWQALFGDGFKAPPAKTSSGKFGVAAAPTSVTPSGRAG